MESSPAVAYGCVYIGSLDSNVYAFGASSAPTSARTHTTAQTPTQALFAITPTDLFSAAIVILVIIVIAVVAFKRRKRRVQATTPATIQPAQPAQPITKDTVDTLERLAALYAQGSLTKEEFDALKKKAMAPTVEMPAWTGPLPVGKLTNKKKNAIVAAVLSIIPGAGQIYVGKVWLGIKWFFNLVFVAAMYVFVLIARSFLQSLGMSVSSAIPDGVEAFWILLWLWQIVDAYRKAKWYSKVVTGTGRAPW